MLRCDRPWTKAPTVRSKLFRTVIFVQPSQRIKLLSIYKKIAHWYSEEWVSSSQVHFCGNKQFSFQSDYSERRAWLIETFSNFFSLFESSNFQTIISMVRSNIHFGNFWYKNIRRTPAKFQSRVARHFRPSYYGRSQKMKDLSVFFKSVSFNLESSHNFPNLQTPQDCHASFSQWGWKSDNEDLSLAGSYWTISCQVFSQAARELFFRCW